MAAEYRLVPEFPGYRVGDDGSVWTCKRRISLGRGRGTKVALGGAWRIVKPYRFPKKGYMQIVFYNERGQGHFFVHRLVLELFIGRCPENMETRHLDGNPANNRLTNLCWGTRYENSQDRRRHGTYPAGDNSPARKLNSDEVHRLKSLTMSEWIGTGDAAELFGITTTQVRNIMSGRSWKCVDGEVLHV